nr:hypothetical protein Itr_chr06CG15080 [Ipomoea trifida]GMD03911.1 hypothetical protein Iba_chr06aCG13430 [Ipomoea batatas]
MTKGAHEQITKDASTSNTSESSKDPTKEKNKRKTPEKRKVKPSKRHAKMSKKATTKKDKSTSVPVVLPIVKETSQTHSDDNGAPHVNQEVVISTSQLPLLTPEEDVETTSLTSNVLPHPYPLSMKRVVMKMMSFHLPDPSQKGRSHQNPSH